MKTVLQNKIRAKEFLLLPLVVVLVAGCGGGEHMKLPAKSAGASGGASTGSKGKTAEKGPEGPFYKTDILPIFQKDCTLCHAKGGALPDWTNYNVAFEKRDRIFNRVVEKKDMPMGAMLSPREIDLISAWIKNGAPEKSSDDLSSSDQPAAESTASPSAPPAEPPAVTPPAPVEQPVTPPAPSTGVSGSSGTDAGSSRDASATTPVQPPKEEPAKANEVVSYKKDIQPIFANRCTSCHTPTGFLPDWMEYQTASAMAQGIKTRVVVKKDMPMGFPMPDEERELVRRWVDGGALE